MNEMEIKILFNAAERKMIDLETSKKILQEIIETIESQKNYCQNQLLLKLYALSTGSLFLKNGLMPWEIAEKSIYASELYLSKDLNDYEVNYNYLTLAELTFMFEKAYNRALGLYKSDNKEVHNLAVQFLSHLTFYHEGLISQNEYEKYDAEYQMILQKK